VDRANGSGGPRAGDGSRVHGGPTDGARSELAGVWARRCSRARDLVVAAWGARGEDGDPYPGWHEWVEGLGRPGDGEGTRWRSKLDDKRLGARGWGEGSGFEHGENGRGCGAILYGPGGSGGERRQCGEGNGRRRFIDAGYRIGGEGVAV
jgi:hypothetical protein